MVAGVDDVGAFGQRGVSRQQVGVVAPVGEEEWCVGAQVEEVQGDAGHVSDQRVGAPEHREDVAVRPGHVAGPRVALVRRTDRGHDLAVPAGDGRNGRGRDPRVRLVHHPHVGQREQRLDDPDPEAVHGGPVVRLALALPGGGVHDRTAGRRGQLRGELEVELRSPDRHHLAVVEVDQGLAVALDRDLTGHEDPVVGLDLVGEAGQLVALAVVDVDVQHPRVVQRLEVAEPVVHVDADLELAGVVEVHQVEEGGHADHRQRGAVLHLAHRAQLAQDDHDPVGAGQLLEDRQPLVELVGPVRCLGEVDRDLGVDRDAGRGELGGEGVGRQPDGELGLGLP